MRILTLCYEYPPIGGGGGRVAQAVAAKPAETFKAPKSTFAMISPPKGAKVPTTDGGQPVPGAAPVAGLKATPGTPAAKTNTPEQIAPGAAAKPIVVAPDKK